MGRHFDPFMDEGPGDDVSVADLGIVVATLVVLLGVLILSAWVGFALGRWAALW